MKRERLFARIPTPRVGSCGIARQDVERVQVVPELVGEILNCLRSHDVLDVGFGLYFSECLQPRPEFTAVVGPALPTLASLIRDLLAHPHWQVRADAVRAFVAYRQCFDDYRTKMQEFLRSSDSEIRRLALGAAPTFVSPKELNLLLPFREDLEIGETGGMGGPLRYNLRDFALEMAEHIAGRRFDCGECLDRRDGAQIVWRSWSAFNNWLEGRKKWDLFRK